MGRSGRTRESAASDGARTRPHATYAVPAARSMAEHRANAPTLPPAAPHRLRVPRARAAQAAADQAAAWQRLGRLRRRRSSASSRARLGAPLQLLRRSFLQPLLRPRERHDGFLGHHRFSTKYTAVRLEPRGREQRFGFSRRKARKESFERSGWWRGGAGIKYLIFGSGSTIKEL